VFCEKLLLTAYPLKLFNDNFLSRNKQM